MLAALLVCASLLVLVSAGADIGDTSVIPFLIKPEEKTYISAVSEDGVVTCAFRTATTRPVAGEAEAAAAAAAEAAANRNTAKVSLEEARAMLLGDLKSCLVGNDALGYRYDVCFGPGATIRQTGLGENNLVGKFEGPTKDGISLAFAGGDICGGTNAQRLATVFFSCDKTLGVLGIQESAKCVYNFYVGTPLVCKDDRFNVQPVRIEQTAARLTGSGGSYAERWVLEAHVTSVGDVVCRAALVAPSTGSSALTWKKDVELAASAQDRPRLEVVSTLVREQSRAEVVDTTLRMLEGTKHRVALDVQRDDATEVAFVELVVRPHQD